jgi:hypothetical protein
MERTHNNGRENHLKPTVHVDAIPELAAARQRSLARAGVIDRECVDRRPGAHEMAAGD